MRVSVESTHAQVLLVTVHASHEQVPVFQVRRSVTSPSVPLGHMPLRVWGACAAQEQVLPVTRHAVVVATFPLHVVVRVSVMLPDCPSGQSSVLVLVPEAHVHSERFVLTVCCPEGQTVVVSTVVWPL